MPETLDAAALDEPEEPRRRGLWKKLKRGLLMTHTELIERLEAAVEGRAFLDDETLEDLEETLIGADLGVETSLELVERLKQEAKRAEGQDILRLRRQLVDEIAVLLLDAPQPPASVDAPRVTLVVGVNGVGKTTSVAKLARHYQRQGRRVLMVAADTFRAAATEQLCLWAERVGTDVIHQREGGDPAAVVYDALHAARARGAQEILIDTAGRLHTKHNLMAELSKIDRVIEREASDWVRFTLLVLDATTGHNAVTQAKEFTAAVPVDGILLAKLDGTAKGGMAVAVARELRLPVVFLGVGETADDLVDFRPREFAAALVG
jgi:fused signal recognition particle receptor